VEAGGETVVVGPASNRLVAIRVAILVSVALFCADCGSNGRKLTERPIGAVTEIKQPLGLPPVPMPADNPATAQTIELGRKLFYDKRLSGDNSLSCSSCHNPTLGFTDHQKHSVGMGGKIGTRNAPTVVNAAYSHFQFWDGRAPSLEEQAAGPIANPIEMNQTHDVSVSKLAADPVYQALFKEAFGPGPVTIGKVEKALASFERTVLSGDSPFDRYQYGGDKTAMTPAAIRGLAIFTDKDKGNCVTCHTIEKDYALFTDGKFHNIGVGIDMEGNLKDLGRYNESRVEHDKGAFKTPTLRNIANSAPYMHDGSLKTLKDVMEFYAGGGDSNPYLDKEMKKIQLTYTERADLIEFLQSLTGKMPANAGPP
jgi:cytochrome c peroxidase